MSVQLMKMLYMFLFSKAKPLNKKHEERKGSITEDQTKSPQNPYHPGSKGSPDLQLPPRCSQDLYQSLQLPLSSGRYFQEQALGVDADLMTFENVLDQEEQE